MGAKRIDWTEAMITQLQDLIHAGQSYRGIGMVMDLDPGVIQRKMRELNLQTINGRSSMKLRLSQQRSKVKVTLPPLASLNTNAE